MKVLHQGHLPVWLLLLFFSCNSPSLLQQGSNYVPNKNKSQKIDCITDGAAFYQTPDYTLFHCMDHPHAFFYMPASLTVETDANDNPLIFSQYIKNHSINLIARYTYDNEKFIEASNHLKSLNAANNLYMLPVNSIDIVPGSIIPERKIVCTGIGDSELFEGYITFQIRGKKQVEFMRSLLLGANGYQMLYKFRYPIQVNGTLLQKGAEIPIYIRNINF